MTYGLYTFLICIVYIVIHIIGSYQRYNDITKLSSDINKILHGENGVIIEEYSEGELSILKSEIYKMTIRLKSQREKLFQDKIFLADSIADISHQIRTPLTSINLLLAMLTEEGMSESKKQKIINEINSLLSRIEWLVTSLLKMSKLDAKTVELKKETIAFEDFLKKAVEPIEVPIDIKEQKLILEGTGNFVGDISWTSEAILNIVKNCMEHTQVGGEIKILAEENPIFYKIQISDNGPGIPKEDLPYIFERFYKGKNSDSKGFGVGLALARTIISNQGGTIKAENLEKGGACFTIKFYKSTI